MRRKQEEKTLSTDTGEVQTDGIGNLAIVHAVGGTQDDLRALRLSARHLPATCETLKDVAFVARELDFARCFPPCHAAAPIRGRRIRI
jgi:hypothetical protein